MDEENSDGANVRLCQARGMPLKWSEVSLQGSKPQDGGEVAGLHSGTIPSPPRPASMTTSCVSTGLSAMVFGHSMQTSVNTAHVGPETSSTYSPVLSPTTTATSSLITGFSRSSRTQSTQPAVISTQSASQTDASILPVHLKHGLSTGATAGTAVACSIVGLAVVGALLFFLLRRRSRVDKRIKHDRDQEKTGVFGSDEHRLQHVAEVAFIPFTDQLGRGYHVADGVAVSARHSGELTNQLSSPVVKSQSHTRRGRTADGFPRSVAHLVEDGMTEDDIRRLMEEERQIDTDIARRR